VKDTCQADKALHGLINGLIGLINASVSLCDASIGLSNPPHRLCNARISLASVSISLIRTENGRIDAFVRLGTALVKVSITTIEVRSTRAERVNELMNRTSSPDDLCSTSACAWKVSTRLRVLLVGPGDPFLSLSDPLFGSRVAPVRLRAPFLEAMPPLLEVTRASIE
jgi:hypothetical protein